MTSADRDLKGVLFDMENDVLEAAAFARVFMMVFTDSRGLDAETCEALARISMLAHDASKRTVDAWTRAFELTRPAP